MKKIFVATDFSPASVNAGKYAVNLAAAFGGEVFLFHAFQIPVLTGNPMGITREEDMKRVVLNDLAVTAGIINPENRVRLTSGSKEGPAEISILEAALGWDADIILCGMKESGHGVRKVLGSTVSRIIGKTTIPIMVIPENIGFGSPENILLATEAVPDIEISQLEPVKWIGERYQSKIFVVHVVKSRLEAIWEVLHQPNRLSSKIRSLDLEYEYPIDKDVSRGLNDFISQHKIDMLVMIPQRHSLFEKWFYRSTTREMLYETDIPLLLLPEAAELKSSGKNESVSAAKKPIHSES